MFIPIGDNQIKGGVFPYISYGLIALNISIYLFQTSLSQIQLESFVLHYEAIPDKAIIMTSLTTILALIPLFFMSGLGADLQKPLAITVIGGLTLGTFISLYLIPILYYYILTITQTLAPQKRPLQ